MLFTVFPLTVNVVTPPVVAIPETVVAAVVVPDTPETIEFAVEPPIVLPVTVVAVLAPVVLIPVIPQETPAAFPAPVIPPITLFTIANVPVEVAWIPKILAFVEFETVIAPVPVEAPIIFGVMSPTETFPPKTEIPAKIPGAVVVPLVLVNEIPEIVFP